MSSTYTRHRGPVVLTGRADLPPTMPAPCVPCDGPDPTDQIDALRVIAHRQEHTGFYLNGGHYVGRHRDVSLNAVIRAGDRDHDYREGAHRTRT